MTDATLNINLNAIYKNLNRLQNLSEQAVETAVVLKADAYGLGVDPIAKYLFDKGVRTFFVATVTEALELSLLLPVESQIYYLKLALRLLISLDLMYLLTIQKIVL